MTYSPEYKALEIERRKFAIRRKLAGKGYPASRVTDNRAQWHLRRKDYEADPSPARENRQRRYQKRLSLILQALIIWGAVAWAVWYLFF